MRERGPNVSAWNWKLEEIQDGKLPPDEDTMAKYPINLNIELSRVDAEVEELKSKDKKKEQKFSGEKLKLNSQRTDYFY